MRKNTATTCKTECLEKQGDLTLPDTRDCKSTSVKIDNSVVPGIGWSLSIENSSCVGLGINPYPGSDLTIRDSYLSMAMIRLTGDRFYYVPGEFKNRQYHADHTFASIPDRKLRLINSTVEWWIGLAPVRQRRFSGQTGTQAWLAGPIAAGSHQGDLRGQINGDGRRG